jgi:enoyl-CoA hydratase
LSRIVGLGRAKELSLTGNFLGAEAARDWGIVNRVVAPEELLPTAQALARDIAGIDPAMVRGYKKLIDDGYALPFADGLALEQRRSKAANTAVRAEEVEARRLAVIERGRARAG